jgi:predicted Zn finger-like uncharacterized protein
MFGIAAKSYKDYNHISINEPKHSMILTCPQCSTRYMLPVTTLAPQGHRVKCTSCQTIWFQLPDPEELEELSEVVVEERSEDIPEGVKPLTHDTDITFADVLSSVNKQETPSGGSAGGYVAAALVFAAAFGLLIALHGSITKSWPAATGFYNVLGIETAAPGEGLIFDKLVAKGEESEKGERVIIEGEVINLTKETREVPLIEASLLAKDGKILDQWYIRLQEKIVEGEKYFAFSADYATREIAQDIKLRFVLKARQFKTDEEDAENIPAHHQDAQPHPSADAEVSGSPEPSSAPTHPEPSHESPEASHSDSHPPQTDGPADHSASPQH